MNVIFAIKNLIRVAFVFKPVIYEINFIFSSNVKIRQRVNMNTTRNPFKVGTYLGTYATALLCWQKMLAPDSVGSGKRLMTPDQFFRITIPSYITSPCTDLNLIPSAGCLKNQFLNFTFE